MEPIEFGKYLLVERLAEGGMAVVWRAKIVGPGGFEKVLGVKQIRPELASRKEFIDLFVAEAKVTVSLTHANIVPVYELGRVDGTYFLALELVDGPPLATLIKGGPIAPALAAYIVEQVLRGLDYAHRNGVVHRDLSSANVLVSRDGEVKIVDFGIAAPVDARGVQGGSRGYMAPEQSSGGAVDARSDLYAVGVLLAEILSGERHNQAEPPRVSTPTALASIVEQATRARPEDRFDDAAQMLSAVSRVLRDADAPTQADLSRLVRERCPDVPLAARLAEGAPSEGPGPRTRPVTGRARRPTGNHVTFATRVVLDDPPAPTRSRRAIVAAVGFLALAAIAAPFALRTFDSDAGPTAKRDVIRSPAPSPSPRPQAPADLALDSSADLAPASPSPKPVVVRPTGRGTLTINALPWAHVIVDGTQRGDTPLQKLALPAGAHTVKLLCPPLNKETRLTVQITADVDTKRVVDFRSGEPKLIE